MFPPRPSQLSKWLRWPTQPMWHRSLVSGMHRNAVVTCNQLMFSMIFRHSTWQAKKLQASCIAFLHQTLQHRALLLENYVTWALCSHSAMKHQWNSAPKRIRHASYKSCSALTWCISLGHATFNMGCVKCCSTPFIILYIFSFHNKHQWRMQALSRDSLEHQHTLSHVSTLCNIAFHQQSEKIQQVDSSRCCCPKFV